jgi:hypothetical protein
MIMTFLQVQLIECPAASMLVGLRRLDGILLWGSEPAAVAVKPWGK